MTDVEKLKFLHITHMADVEKFYISPHHKHDRCGEILYFSTSVMLKNLKFLHMTDFSLQVPPVVPVTNMRYDISPIWIFVKSDSNSTPTLNWLIISFISILRFHMDNIIIPHDSSKFSFWWWSCWWCWIWWWSMSLTIKSTSGLASLTTS